MAEQHAGLVQALGLMETALKLLDEANASPDVGAHLDLAIDRLKDALGMKDQFPWAKPGQTR